MKATEFEYIAQQLRPQMMRVALDFFPGEEDAEDVVQEVLLGVFRRLREKTKVDSVEQYLIRSISNACTDYFRRKPMKIVSLDKAEHISVNESD